MSTILRTPVKSEYGFQSNNFTVDIDGNISARSISLIEEEVETDVPADYIITDENSNFVINGTQINPDITIFRNGTVTVDIELDSLFLFIYQDDLETLFNNGIRHDDGTSGLDAQGKNSGRLFFTVPLSAPDVLYYSNESGSIFGRLIVEDPEGIFSSIRANAEENSIDLTTGSVVAKGGAAITKDLRVGDSIISSSIRSDNNLNLDVNGTLEISTSGNTIGVIDSQGISLPIINTTINNTTIGNSNPADATFANAVVLNAPSTDNSVVSKGYTDTQSLTFSIVFGI